MAPRQPNGLTENDELILRRILAKAEAITPGRAYLGGRERQALDELVRDVKGRLEPLTAEALSAQAAELFATVRETDWGKAALEGADA